MVKFRHLIKNILGKRIFCHKFPGFSEKKNHHKTKIKKPAKKIITIANNMKGLNKIFYFHIFNILRFG